MVVLRIHFHDHISIFAFGAFENIVLVNFVVSHEITYFGIIGTNPEIKPIIFIELILERETAYWTPDVKQINYLHIDFISWWDAEIFD